MKAPVHAHRILELLERYGASGGNRQPSRDDRSAQPAVDVMREGDDARRPAPRGRRRRRSR